jgi:hypothetical protein
MAKNPAGWRLDRYVANKLDKVLHQKIQQPRVSLKERQQLQRALGHLRHGKLDHGSRGVDCPGLAFAARGEGAGHGVGRPAVKQYVEPASKSKHNSVQSRRSREITSITSGALSHPT